MNIIRSFLFLLISLLASVAGAICGIGGGVIIKPTLDLFGWEGVATISFLSGCTVLSMSAYSVVRSLVKRDSTPDGRVTLPLAIGAAAGGILGNRLFGYIKACLEEPDGIGAIQAVCLTVITLGTLLYTLFRDRIPTHRIKSIFLCIVIGLLLGLMSSFLGIGGGPINLVVLFFFFGMDTKTAATASLYIIFLSQLTNLLTALIGGTVPDFPALTLALMIVGGIAGGIIGRRINSRIAARTVDKLFIGLMALIIMISIYNIFKYTLLAG